MDDMMTDIALTSMRMSEENVATQYSIGLMRKTMDVEAQEAAQLLEMMSQNFQVSGPQPGDIPALLKGSILDTYA